MKIVQDLWPCWTLLETETSLDSHGTYIARYKPDSGSTIMPCVPMAAASSRVINRLSAAAALTCYSQQHIDWWSLTLDEFFPCSVNFRRRGSNIGRLVRINLANNSTTVDIQPTCEFDLFPCGCDFSLCTLWRLIGWLITNIKIDKGK